MEFNKAYNRSEFVTFLRTKFLPEDFVQETTELEFATQTKYATSAVKLGSSEQLDLAVLEIKHKSKHDARVGLSKEAFRLLADEGESRALVIFVPEDNNANYRFSLIEITLGLSENSPSVTRTYSNPRRYSYYLGEGVGCYTPNKYLNKLNRVTDEQDLQSRFSVEVLTKAFYQELSDWYAWAVKVVRFPNKLGDTSDDSRYNSEAAIRLVTRLIFVWFLKQKNLIPEEFFDKEEINKLIKGFTPDRVTDLMYMDGESVYYKAILQNLFFAMLNSPITPEGKETISERRFSNADYTDHGNHKLMRYEKHFKDAERFLKIANETVPFLNGGLFDCLDRENEDYYVDGFSDREKVKKALFVPDYLFFIEDHMVDLSLWYNDKKKSRVMVNGIINILKRYNFTIEENTPFDQDVSLDPELLGKVFENLLASYNPETQTTARKQTGSFYTPREIVQYMVDESLVAHLKRTVGDELEPEYRKLISYVDDDIQLTSEQKIQVMESIYQCKVLDPACGSGAFPVGMLQQMVHILSQLDPTNEQWKEMMLNKAINETSEAYRTATDEERREMVADIERNFDKSINRPDYARKLYLIENCIYGVDIQPIAIQISKLRFFISLVVDQKTTNDPVKNFGIRPLPNLEAKFVAANSLIPLAKTSNNLGRTPDIIELENKLKEANHKIFSADKYSKKTYWKNRLAELRIRLAEKLASDGFLTSGAVNQIASWNMFDQNSAASFFDADWMFGIKDGFDIVIANPPYLKERDNKSYFAPVYATPWGRNYHSGKMDFWYYFMHKSLELTVENAVICFVTSRYWIKSKGASKLIRHIHSDATILQIVDFGKLKVFDSVVGLHMISLIKKGHKLINCNYYKIDNDVANIKSRNFSEQRIIQHNQIISNNEINIEEQILQGSTLKTISLKEKFTVSQGVVEAPAKVSSKMYNKHPNPNISVGYGVFVLTDFEVENLCFSKYEKDRCLVRYITDGGIHMYDIETASTQNLIYADKELRGLISNNTNYDFNNVKQHLDYCSCYITSSNAPYGLHRPRAKSAFLQAKIIGPSMFKTPMFAYDDKGYFVGMSYNIINQRENDFSLYFLLGILNSKYAACWFWQNAKHRGVGVDVGVAKLEEFPLPKYPSSDIISEIERYVREIITDKNKISLHTIHIDKLVYHLYNLTYDEILIVDPETPITREEYEKTE